MGVILGPFWNNFEAICQVELSSRSFHALSCPVASSTVYRARPLVCRVVKAVVSCAALADWLVFGFQSPSIVMSSYQIFRFMHGAGRLLRFMYTDRYLHHVVATSMPSYRFGTKSFQLSLSRTERYLFQLLRDCGGSDVFAVPNPIP